MPNSTEVDQQGTENGELPPQIGEKRSRSTLEWAFYRMMSLERQLKIGTENSLFWDTEYLISCDNLHIYCTAY